MAAGKEGTNQESEFGKVLIYSKNQKFALVGGGEGGWGFYPLISSFQASKETPRSMLSLKEMENCAYKPIWK